MASTRICQRYDYRRQIGDGPLTEKTVIQLGIQLAKGLAAAHPEDIIHRDLEPGNLRLTADGQLKILDFGLYPMFRRTL